MSHAIDTSARDASRRTITLATIVALGGFLFGLDASVISGVIGFITPEFGLNEWQIGLVVGAPTLAGIASSIGSGLLSDYIGRKRVLIALAALYTVSSIAAAIAPNYETLVAARFVGGFAFASLGIAPMYIAEIAPAEKRGLLVSFNQFNIMIGFSAAYFANYFLLHASQDGAAWVQALGIDRHTWRWMLGVGALPAAVWWVLLFGIPESPRWLVVKGRLNEARAVLERIRPPARVEAALAEITESAAEPVGSLRSRFNELFKPALKLPLAIGLIIGIAQQVTGINAVYFYAPSIFEQTGVGTNAAFAQAILIGIINIIFTVIAMLLIDRLGRKPLLMIGLAGVIVSTSLCSYAFNQARYQITESSVTQLSARIDHKLLAPIVGVEYSNDIAFKQAVGNAIGTAELKKHEAQLIQASIKINPYLVLSGILGFVASFALSLGPVMWVLFSEIFPNRIRGIAMAFVGFFNSLASFAVQFLFPWELAHLGNAWTFSIYAILGAVSLVLMAWLLPETRGRTLEQLEADFAAR
ncbi:sugar porter (SP) family MFS transporter [Povalibacter uvarum]|uniref:Sugar porter (SP) family MFS transporter n=1 Tax=Povalibacter uvarum TaxID=732238 RepID=A0A841HJW4_9GAMM|nr:MFS transporter [Povalibacter uvarum]MBB6093501.1 sugar porter (SP) family MFS transporter [Povalibacter uvarum]